MIIFAHCLVATFILLICAAPASAADIQFHKGEKGGGYIFINGEIQKGDADKFRKLAAGSQADLVFLRSQGGSLSEAFEIGRIITVSSYSTFVLDDHWCASACALIWIAGEKRYVQPKSHIGFHAGYTVDGGEPITSGMANALIGRYLTQLNLPANAIIFATSATPDRMAWLDISHPGSEGISFFVVPSNTAAPSTKNSSAPPPLTTIAKLPTAEPPLSGQTFGKWKVFIDSDNYGVGTSGSEGKGLFSYFCPIAKSCRYAARIDMSCDPGDQYTIKYRVDGYLLKTIDVTCDTDGQTLYLNNDQVFGKDIKGEIGVTFLTQNSKGDVRSIRFNLVGLDEAVDALVKAGYITDPKN